jgi:hypothetical protein
MQGSLARVRDGEQLNVGLARHTHTQLTCRIASKSNGLRLLQGACETSRSMLPRRARATRVRRVPQSARASKGSALEAGSRRRRRRSSEGPKRAQWSGALSSACGEKSSDIRCHSQTAGGRVGRLRRTNAAGTPGARLPPSTAPHRLTRPQVSHGLCLPPHRLQHEALAIRCHVQSRDR